MKFGILITLMFGIAIAEANGFYPYYPNTFVNQAQFNTRTENLSVVDTLPVYQQVQQQNDYYYPDQVSGYYPDQPPLYPLFYYLPEIRDVSLQTTDIPEFQDINDILDKKSEQAIRQNNLNYEDETLSSMQDELDNESNLSGMELSKLTASRLIVSARKKQFLEKLIPILLNNPRIFHQDREKLEEMFNNMDNGIKISAADEIWLKKLVKDYRLSKQLLNDTRAYEHFEAISQLNQPFSNFFFQP